MIGEAFNFYALLPISELDKFLQWLIWGPKKVVARGVRQVVALYSNN